jgi:hypothetical protein
MRPLDKKRGRLSRNGSPNLRLELGHVLEPTPMRTTEFTPSVKEPTAEQAPVQGYGKPSVALPWKAGRFWARTSPTRATACCPVRQARRCGQPGGARIGDCRGCPKRLQCQWHGEATTRPRRRSLLLHPLRVGPGPLRLSGLEPQTTSACLYRARATPTHRGEPTACGRSFATASRTDPFARTASARSPLVERRGWLAMRVLQRLVKSRSSCSAFQNALPPRLGWRQLNTVLRVSGLLLLGQACLSEWSLMASFAGCCSLLPLFCLLCSPSR